MDNVTTKVEYLKRLSPIDQLVGSLDVRPEKILVIYDKRLARVPAFMPWLKSSARFYAVTAGEPLKDFANFPLHLKKILKILGPFSPRSTVVVAVGGGSVGDFAGFLSSVLKRGVPLVHVPTTLLAAMDSAHGGKTALNVGGNKNQVGTYYPATAVWIVKSFFADLPPLQLQSAGGELAKMALLTGGQFFADCANFRPTAEQIWSHLDFAIKAKYAIVDRDPFERSGERQVLNFGHTLGHALEAYFKIPHGVGIGYGLVFAVNWSAHCGYLKNPGLLLTWLETRFGFGGPKSFVRSQRLMSRDRLKKFLCEDKKMTDAENVNFIFLEGPGQVFRKKVPIDSFLTETQRQGWTRT